MDEIIAFLCVIRQLSPECQNYLRKVVQKRLVKKGEKILLAGEVCTKLHFIAKGLLRCYYEHNGKELTDWFFWEMDAVVSVKSWYTQKPSNAAIEALEDCVLYFISYQDLEYIYDRYPEFNFIGRILTTKYLLVWHDLATGMRDQSAEEKYQFLMSRPEMLLRVPLKHLATWLSMNESTLSRMRSNLANN